MWTTDTFFSKFGQILCAKKTWSCPSGELLGHTGECGRTLNKDRATRRCGEVIGLTGRT